MLVGFISQLTNLLHFLKLSSQFSFGSNLESREERQQMPRTGPGGAEIDELTRKHCHGNVFYTVVRNVDILGSCLLIELFAQ